MICRSLLLLLAVVLSFCSAIHAQAYLEGSFDFRNIHETGSPAPDYISPGWNAAIAWITGGLTGEYRGWNDSRYDFSTDEVAARKPTGGLALGPRAEIVRKGAKTDGGTLGLTYIDVAGDVLYTQGMKDDGMMFAGLGPYVGYGISGRVTFNGMHTPAFGGQGYKRLDAGLDLSAGYRLHGVWFFSLGYELGLADKSPDPSEFRSYNRSFSLNVGYSLDKIVGGFKRG